MIIKNYASADAKKLILKPFLADERRAMLSQHYIADCKKKTKIMKHKALAVRTR